MLGAALVLHGIVMGQACGGGITVRHAAFGAMPAMTMSFHTRGIAPPPAGTIITATVDRRTQPSTLDHVVRNCRALQRPAYVPTLRVGDVVPDIPLIDQDGRPLTLRKSAGPTLVSFIYTRCTDARMCPLVTAKFGRLRSLLRDTPIRLVEVTLDPQYDRPAVLRRYAKAFDAGGRWLFATGSVSDVTTLAERFGILRGRVPAGTLSHSEELAIVSVSGVVESLVDGNDWIPEDVAAAARQVAGFPSDPFRRLALGLFARVSAACGAAGAGGFSLLGAIAVFVTCLSLAGWAAFRLFASAFRPPRTPVTSPKLPQKGEPIQ